MDHSQFLRTKFHPKCRRSILLRLKAPWLMPLKIDLDWQVIISKYCACFQEPIRSQLFSSQHCTWHGVHGFQRGGQRICSIQSLQNGFLIGPLAAYEIRGDEPQESLFWGHCICKTVAISTKRSCDAKANRPDQGVA